MTLSAYVPGLHPCATPSGSNAYFVTVRGARHNLGPDRKNAFRRFHELMATNDNPAPPAATAPTASLTVAEVFEKFLDW